MRRPILAASISLATLTIFMVSGALLANSYYAQFNVSTSTVSAILPSLASHTAPFDVTLDSSYLVEGGGPGEAEYWITGTPKCLLYEGFDCVEFTPDLCNYLSITSTTDTEETEYTQFLVGNDWYKVAQGVLVFEDHVFSHPNDLSDGWSVAIHAPCFEGECPVGYDAGIHGTPLPLSLKGQTFTCDLNVDTGYFPISLRNILATERVYAQSEGNGHIIEVSAVFSGVEETPACTENCNSNVMFLPGLQASRLYKPDYSGGTDRLWEPNGNADVRDLYLDSDGKSIRSDIYATNVVGTIFGLHPDIYKSFIEMMDQLKFDQKINDWSPIPYDWRLTVDDILDNGTKIDDGYSYHTASATPYVFQELDRLAATSRTGKVTVVAHSNGGLVAKALMVRLEQMGKAGLVDKVILLASPQLGTPKAIASLLHGEDQEYLGGVIMDKPTARELGRNMPGGYQLLPSKAYFDTVVDSPVMIRNTSSTQSLFQAYGTSTDSVEELYKLLRGDEGRTGASTDDVESLINLNGALLTQAKDLHALIDRWVAPTSTQVIEIAGWGLDTIRGIRYTDRAIEGCTVGSCRRLSYTPLFTDDGDETVVLPSAMATASSTRYWVDLFEANRKEDEKWSHKNISEVIQVRELLKNLLLNGTDVLPKYISTSPSPTSITKKMRYTLHSPLTLGIYDNRGRYTGLSSSTIPGVEYPVAREEIPNSYYMEFGETKIVGFEEGSFTISMEGEALGTFTLEGEKIEAGVIIASTTFPDIPVATGTIVTLLQPVGVLAPTISVDFDGNGTTDVQIGQEGFSEADSVALLRGMVGTLGLGIKQEKRLLTMVDRLDNVVKKEFKKPEKKVARLSKVLERLTEVVTKLSQKGKITNDDKNELLKLIVVVRQQVIQ